MSEMAPGYLHFNLHSGCTADMLNGCMAKFLGSTHCVNLALKALGMDEITCDVSESVGFGLRGLTVNFYLGGIIIRQNNLSLKPSTEEQNLCKNSFIKACLTEKTIGLNRIREIFFDAKVSPELAALATKVLASFSQHSDSDPKFAGEDALWLFCQLLMLCTQIVALDPKFISASRPFVSEEVPLKKYDFTTLEDRHLINAILIGIPAIECSRVVAVDALALSFIKSLAGHFGARGESTIMSSAVGFSHIYDPLNPSLVEALWCEASLPDSMSEVGPSSKARIKFLYEVRGLVSAGRHNIDALCRMLLSHGAKSLHYFFVYNEKNQGHNLVHFLVAQDQKREAIEAFLVKGEANEVCIREIEQHELKKRVVNVPMGSGNKTYSYRFYEYLYLDKTLRVEPMPEDLSDYIKKTDYSVDVARSDMVLAWKKWRQRVAES